MDPALFPQMEKEGREAMERRKLKEEVRSAKAERKRKLFEKHGHDYDSESGGSDSEQMLKAGVVKLDDGTKYSGQLLEGVPQVRFDHSVVQISIHLCQEHSPILWYKFRSINAKNTR